MSIIIPELIKMLQECGYKTKSQIAAEYDPLKKDEKKSGKKLLLEPEEPDDDAIVPKYDSGRRQNAVEGLLDFLKKKKPQLDHPNDSVSTLLPMTSKRAKKVLNRPDVDGIYPKDVPIFKPTRQNIK
jgi:hypothetical protein